MAMQIGGWYNNPAQGNQNMRYWGDKGWTTGADPGSGGAPSGGSNTFTTGPTPVQSVPQVDFSSIYGQAQNLFGGIMGTTVDDMQKSADQVTTDAASKASAIRALSTPTQNLYTALAGQIDQNYNLNTQQNTFEKQSTVGQQATQAAAGGFDTHSGFEAAQGRNTTNYYDTKEGLLTNQYNAAKQQNTSEEQKAIADLEVQAQDAILTGDTTRADILGKMAGLKLQGASLVNDAARNIITGQDRADANYFRNLYEQGQLQDKAIALDQAQQKIDDKTSKAAGTGGSGLGLSDLATILGLTGGGAPAPAAAKGGASPLSQFKVATPNASSLQYNPFGNTGGGSAFLAPAPAQPQQPNYPVLTPTGKTYSPPFGLNLSL